MGIGALRTGYVDNAWIGLWDSLVESGEIVNAEALLLYRIAVVTVIDRIFILIV